MKTYCRLGWGWIAPSQREGMNWDAAARPTSYTWTDPQDRKARDIQIREWWALGDSAREIGDRVGLTPQRIAQIVRFK